MPVIGYLSARTPEDSVEILADFRRGLAETGFVEGRNVTIEYRWLDGRYEKLPEMMADLVSEHVSVVVVPNTTASARAAQKATQTIPVVFNIGSDPVEMGLVELLSRPGKNVTGVAMLQTAVTAKRLDLLHELVPDVRSIGFLVNPANPGFAEAETKEVQQAARILGIDLLILAARNEEEIDAAFTRLARQSPGALLIGGDVFYISRTDQLVSLAARYRIPAIYAYLEQGAAGALMCYGARRAETQRLVGLYAGRILKGEKPADLPVQQVTKMELSINIKTAKALESLKYRAICSAVPTRSSNEEAQTSSRGLGARRHGRWWRGGSNLQSTSSGTLVEVTMLARSFYLVAISQGLGEQGFIEGKNVQTLYRFAEARFDRLPMMAVDLIDHGADIILATGGASAVLAAKSVTTTIPIVMVLGADPVQLGLVASLNHPGGNITGVTFLATTLVGKRLELLHLIAPGATSIGFLFNPQAPQANDEIKEAEIAAATVGLRLLHFKASTQDEIARALETMSDQQVGAFLTAVDPLFYVQNAALFSRSKVPMISNAREMVQAGCILSYGPSFVDSFRIAATYMGRILKGERPADLPVQQSTKLEIAVNLKTAKALSIDIPPSILVRADEVIE